MTMYLSPCVHDGNVPAISSQQMSYTLPAPTQNETCGHLQIVSSLNTCVEPPPLGIEGHGLLEFDGVLSSIWSY